VPIEADLQQEDFRILQGGAAPLVGPMLTDPEPVAFGGTYSRSRSLLELPALAAPGAEPLRVQCGPRVAAELVAMIAAKGAAGGAFEADFLETRRLLIESCSRLALGRIPCRWRESDFALLEALGEGDHAGAVWHVLAVSMDGRFLATFARHHSGIDLVPQLAPVSVYILTLAPGVRERQVGAARLRAGSQVHLEAATVPEAVIADPFVLARRVPRRSLHFAQPNHSTSTAV